MAEPIRINRTESPAPAHTLQPAQRPGGSAGATAPAGSPSFAETLSKAQNGEAQALRFSNHAQKRLETRNITLSDDGISRLASAVDKAEKRGGKESLVLVDDMAFIVNVKDRLVVTALDAQSRGEGVFTQIDSVVFADPVEPKPIMPNNPYKTNGR